MKAISISFAAILGLVFFVLIFTGNISVNTGEETENYEDSIPVTGTLRLIFAGDVMGHSTQTTGAWRDGGDSRHNFIPTFQWVKDYISSADIAVANLEVTLAGEPYTGYPAFSSPVSLAVALQDAGFDMLLTANNHILDRGARGLERTINVLDSLGITHTGSYRNLAEREENHPLIMEQNSFRLAFLNYTYGTNMGAERASVIVNRIDTLRMAADLAKARELEVDYIIACLHWGEEYRNEESRTQRQIADFLARHGCNLIVGAHPHVIQPIRKIAGNATDSVLVAYSLGNFVSNQRWRYSDGGIMLDVLLTKTTGVVSLGSYSYEPFWVRRYPEKGVQIYRLIPAIDYLHHPERYPAMSAEEERMLILFYEDTKRILD
jgi:poly-gamma-glutamate synthesis protein (capsule biosynthesis protein)